MSEPGLSPPFTRTDYEAIYWALVDFLTLPDQPSLDRRNELRALLPKLSQHIRELRTNVGAGVRKRVDLRGLVRARLLRQHAGDEEGIWSVYGEEPNILGDLVVLKVVGGRFEDVVEEALGLEGFITLGMGGQIDRLGGRHGGLDATE